MSAIPNFVKRRVALAVCVVAIALASACGPTPNPAPVAQDPAPAAPVDVVPNPTPESQPAEPAEPSAAKSAVIEGTFVAMSNTAMSFTGDLTVTPGAIVAALDQRYSVASASRVPASETYAAGAGSWAQLLTLPEGAYVQLRRVTSQTAGAAAPNGSFCGSEPTTYLGLALAADSLGEPALKIAAFKGKEAPGPKTSEGELCGTFTYSALAPKPAS